MTSTIEKMSIDNKEALANPKPGDYWHEMFSPYFLVVAKAKNDKFIVLSCLGGSHLRPNEPNARINSVGGWYFDYSKSMAVDRDWMTKAVTYQNSPGFAADVVRDSEKYLSIVNEWRDHTSKKMQKQIALLQKEWEEFTGWAELSAN